MEFAITFLFFVAYFISLKISYDKGYNDGLLKALDVAKNIKD